MSKYTMLIASNAFHRSCLPHVSLVCHDQLGEFSMERKGVKLIFPRDPLCQNRSIRIKAMADDMVLEVDVTYQPVISLQLLASASYFQ